MKIPLNDRQAELYKDAGIEYSPDRDFTDDELADAESKLGDYLLQCLDDAQNPTAKSEEVKELLFDLTESA
jgi:hypothetical protein